LRNCKMDWAKTYWW